jgi:hypothetical protein
MTSMAATVAFGVVAAALAPRSCIMPELPDMPDMPDVPEVPELSYPLELPAVPDVPEAPELPLLLDVPVAVPLLPVSPLVPLLPLLPMPPPRQELHADSPTASASKPARKTLRCFCFMINSF